MHLISISQHKVNVENESLMIIKINKGTIEVRIKTEENEKKSANERKSYKTYDMDLFLMILLLNFFYFISLTE